MAVDITIRDPLRPRGPVRCPYGLPGWRKAQESAKTTKYAQACARLGQGFRPFVVDVYGGLAPDAVQVANTLVKALVGKLPSTTTPPHTARPSA